MKEFLEDRTRTSSQTRHAGTRVRIRRRTIYIASVVSILAMVGGFALANLAFSTVSNSGQNGAGVSSGTTIWTGSPSVAPSSSATACAATFTITFSDASATTGLSAAGSAFVAGSSVACWSTGAPDFAEEITMVTGTNLVTCTSSTNPCTSAQADAFYVYSNSGTLVENKVTVSYVFTGGGTTTTCTSGCTGTGTANIFVDYGSTTPPATISALYVVVQGS